MRFYPPLDDGITFLKSLPHARHSFAWVNHDAVHRSQNQANVRHTVYLRYKQRKAPHMLVINDAQLVERLQAIAAREKRSVEDILKTFIERYPVPAPPPDAQEIEASLRRLRQKAYAQARAYWQSVGNTERLALTDAELDEQFWLFDGEGIPRLKSEQGEVKLPEGSLYRLAEIAAEANIEFEGTDAPDGDYDRILNDEFADYLISRMTDAFTNSD